MNKMLKLDIAGIDKDKGKTFHLEADEKIFVGMKIGDVVQGKDISKDLPDYEFILTGASDNAGFPVVSSLEAVGRKRMLLKYGIGMKQRKPHGLRLKKTVHGNTISTDIMQINLKVKKHGSRALSEIYKKEESKEAAVEGKAEKSG
ncbi:MAG: S6e family ribosomal protein [archaeon]